MNYLKLMEERHSVRQYLDKPISEEEVKLLEEKINEINTKSGLNFKLYTNEPKAFGGRIPSYGSFKNAHNYIVCAGKKTNNFEEKYGYYGEELVLYAQSLGLNTCWVGATVSKKDVKKQLGTDEQVGCFISIGYGATQGFAHKNKDIKKITKVPSPWPRWFYNGVKGAMLAPTAVNSQRFKIDLLSDGKVEIKAGIGPYAKVDLGIVKYQFEKAAGEDFPGFNKLF